MKYDAFISYRHLERDMFVAKGVHKALETTKIPRKIQKLIGKKRIQRVFRDQEELPIGSDLGDNIEAALAESEFLIVICSPQTKESEWVMKEIDTFISMHGRQNILAVLVDGEPWESFPRQLYIDDYGNTREPLAADVRGISKSEVKKKIKSETLRLAASILHCDYDDLKQRHRERIMRRYFAIAGGVAALGVLFGVYNAYNSARINENYRQKLVNESKVLSASSKEALENGDRKAATLIALEALPGEGNDRPFVPDAMHALSEALGSYSIGNTVKKDKILNHNLPVRNFVTNKGKSRLLSVDNNGNVYYWDVLSGELLFKKDTVYVGGLADNVHAIGINNECASVVSDHYLTGYDEEGNSIYDIKFEDASLYAEYNSDKKLVAVSFLSNLQVYDATNGKLLHDFKSDKYYYGSDIIFDSENKHLAVSVSEDLGSDDYEQMLIYDLETGRSVTVTVAMDTVLKAAFAIDGSMVVASMKLNDLLAAGDHDMMVEKFDVGTGELIWDTTVKRISMGNDMSYTYINTRKIDSEGSGDCFVSASRTLYNFNLETGELKSQFVGEGDIERFYIAVSEVYVYVGSYSGKVYFVNGSNGFNYTDNAITVGDSLADFVAGDGYIIARKYLSPEIVVMSYIADDSFEESYTLDNRLEDIILSPDGSTYSIITKENNSDLDDIIDVYDSETGDSVAHFEVPDIIRDDLVYLDEDTLNIVNRENKVYYLHIDSRESELVDVGMTSFNGSVASKDNSKYFFSEFGKYRLYDMKQRKEIASGEISEDPYESLFRGGVMDSACENLYYYDGSQTAYWFDITNEERHEISQNFKVNSITISDDDSKLACICLDGYVRILDAHSFEVLNKFEFYGNEYNLIQFSKDGSRLFCQGQDYYFKIYDIEKDKLLYISDDQWSQATHVEEHPDKNLVVFRNPNGIRMIDTENYGILVEAENGKLYLDKQEVILSGVLNELYRYKVKTLDELIEEAKEKYPGEELTDAQRLKYKMY